jgi:zinc transporter 5/7
MSFVSHTAPSSIFHDVINGILIPLPFLLAAIAYPVQGPSASLIPGDPPSTNLEKEGNSDVLFNRASYGPLLQTAALSAAALLLVGALAKLQTSDQKFDRRKKSDGNVGGRTSSFLQFGTIRAIIFRMLSIVLPYYASMQLGGLRTATTLLMVNTSGLTAVVQSGQISKGYGDVLGAKRSRKFICAAVLLFASSDVLGITSRANATTIGAGYLALGLAAFLVPIPTSALNRRSNALDRTVSNPKGYSISTPPPTPRLTSSSVGSSMVSTPAETNITLAAGASLGVGTIISAVLLSTPVDISPPALLFSMLSLASVAGLIFFVRPLPSPAKWQPGLATALVLISALSLFRFFGTEMTFFSCCTFGILGYVATLLDGSQGFVSNAAQHKEHEHKSANASLLTTFLLTLCRPGSVMDTILREQDSRRIAYFGCLNLGFMAVQLFYGFATGSLGLLTDSIHMLFDCLGLAVGLAAAVMSKWPPSTKFPYGYGKINTLSGFANGIFLILVSIEIIFDAIHRLNEGHELRRLNELLLVSTLGFLVNIVGLAAFGHAHHGHDHGHDHAQTHSRHESHSHAHSHEKHSHEYHNHDHQHSHDHSHDHEHKHSHEHDYSTCNREGQVAGLGLQASLPPSLPSTPFSMPQTPLPPSPANATHAHDHKNENMKGIFLHIMADALGSVAVIISTIMAKRDGWSGWDPIASCIIAIMIFISAVPLVQSSGMKLLLALPNEVEWATRDALQGISELRGVLGYSGVRLWLQDKVVVVHAHGHDHGHDHGHQHQEEQGQKILGVMHVIAAHGADLEDVRERVVMYLLGKGLDIVVHVEREGDIRCWCGGGVRLNGSVGG